MFSSSLPLPTTRSSTEIIAQRLGGIGHNPLLLICDQKMAFLFWSLRPLSNSSLLGSSPHSGTLVLGFMAVKHIFSIELFGFGFYPIPCLFGTMLP